MAWFKTRAERDSAYIQLAHRYTAGGSETALLSGFISPLRWCFGEVVLFSLVFLCFFPFMLDFPINFNFSWQPLTAKTKDFFPFYWDRLAKSVTAIYRLKITFVTASPTPGVHHPPTSPPHPHSHSLIRTQGKRLKPWMRMNWAEISAAEIFRNQSVHMEKDRGRPCLGSPVLTCSSSSSTALVAQSGSKSQSQLKWFSHALLS